MKYLHLIWAALFRSKTRTLLTLLSVITAFLLFGLLDSVRVAFAAGGDMAGYNRLVVASRLSITQMLPARLESDIANVPGVKLAVRGAWFGGIYQDQRNFFPNMSVGDGFFEMYPEYQIAPEQLQAFETTRIGAVVGESLAQRHGWKVGDTIPLQATIFPTQGSNNWEFKLVGTFRVTESKRKGEENALYFRWDYFNEANDFVKDRVGWWMVQLDDPEQADQIAQTIDKLSENSDHETKTQSEQAFNQAFIKQFADVGMIVSGIMGAVFFTLLLLTGNTMAQAVRERIPELAVLKTIGFSDRSVLALVLVESVLLLVLGGVIGLVLAAVIMPVISTVSGGAVQLPTVPGVTWALGIALMVVIGLLVGALPALRAMRLNIVDALAGR
ncbi:ABC transporter permease [Marilutibacter alkalisoli]|uniref:FtsX-like permease family protein n=1 Tax=Marilutibacter alkalisoli TaxID=2591633 RepID=A0A514BUX8_9GAMM|nr:FtsX-like permease family protein [Lysobacter alkalisoli]QDH71180.1 FtsX-like permease family protein [Lysobacter alkalisoli]